MSLEEKKISVYSDSIKNLSDCPSDDGITAAELKVIFDGRTDKEVKASINGIIDELTSNDAADQIKTKSGESIEEALSGKVSKEEGRGLSTNDYTDEEKGAFNSHILNKENPHGIIARQVMSENGESVEGRLTNSESEILALDEKIGAVDSKLSETKTELNSDIMSLDLEIDGVSDAVSAHADNKENPHGVTATQVTLTSGESVEDKISEMESAPKEAESLYALGTWTGLPVRNILYFKDGLLWHKMDVDDRNDTGDWVNEKDAYIYDKYNYPNLDLISARNLDEWDKKTIRENIGVEKALTDFYAQIIVEVAAFDDRIAALEEKLS